MEIKEKELFEKKGYCIMKEYEYPEQDDEVLKHRRRKITNIEEEIRTFNYEKIEFLNDIDEEENKEIVFYNKDKVEIYIIKNISDYVKCIVDSNKGKKQIYYRGHSDCKYLLLPSIYRQENSNLLINEDKLFRDIIANKPHFFSECTTTLEKLVKMQHHGLPTRLMDLSENPLIALFFACNSNIDTKNGEVLVFNIDENKIKYYDSDTVSVITNISKCNIEFNVEDYDYSKYRSTSAVPYSGGENINIRNMIESFNNKESIRKLVHSIREEKPYFLNRVFPEHLCNYTVVVKPKMTIDRIVNQSGAFVLFGMDKDKKICSEPDINEKGTKNRIIIIPKAYKKSILEELKLFNINESTVYCDIDSTARYFKQKYQ